MDSRKKWSAMLLPQHRERLQQMAADEYNVSPPRLDQDQLEELHYQLQAAIAEQRWIQVTYFKDYSWATAMGQIQKYDPFNGMLQVIDASSITIKIDLKQIKAIEMM